MLIDVEVVSKATKKVIKKQKFDTPFPDLSIVRIAKLFAGITNKPTVTNHYCGPITQSGIIEIISQHLEVFVTYGEDF